MANESEVLQRTPQPQPHCPVLLLDFGGGDHGHRGRYNAMLAQLIPTRHARFTPRTVFARAPILVPQIEHASVAFAFTCLVRAMLVDNA